MKLNKLGEEKEPKAKSSPRENAIDGVTSRYADKVVQFLDAHSLSATITLLLLILSFVFRDFISLQNVFLYKDIGSDTINTFYPILAHTADYVHAFGLPKWSFNAGMGQNIFPFSLIHGPFDLILLLAGKDALVYLLGFVEMLKIFCGGIVFYHYLRLLKIGPFVCMSGSLLFSFSGFMILGGGWYLFSYEAVLIALLLFSFEKLFQQNSWFSFPIVIALIAISMPFYLYTYGVFLLLYAVFRIADERGPILADFTAVFSKLALLGLLGLGISSFFSFANVQALLDSPRGDGSSTYAATFQAASVFRFGDNLHNITALLRAFSSDMMGSGSNFKGWSNYLEAPMFYCGLISLLLFPSVFQFFDRKKTLLYCAFFGLWITPVLFPYFRYAFWLFTGDYYRAFSFFVSFVILLFGIQSLSKIVQTRQVNLFVLFGTLLALWVLLSYNYNSSGSLPAGYINVELQYIARLLLVVYTLLIYLICRTDLKSIAQILLLACLCFELGYFSFVTVNNRSLVSTDEFESKIGYNDYTADAVEWLNANDKSFFRIDKDYSSGTAIHASINDALVQGYYGTSAYNSFNQKYYIRFLGAIGAIHKEVETETRWATGLNTKPFAETVCSVKYFLTKSSFTHFPYEAIARFGDVKVLKNRFHVPFGQTYDAYISTGEFNRLSSYQRDHVMMKAVFVDDHVLSAFKGLTKLSADDIPQTYQLADFQNDQTALCRDTLKTTRFEQNRIEGNVQLDRTKLLFLSIPYDKGWKATVNGIDHPILIVDSGLSGLMLTKGEHAIKLEYDPPFIRIGFICSVVSLSLFGIVMVRQKRPKPESPAEQSLHRTINEQAQSE